MSRRISYAANGEDVVLHRALGDLEAVNYVDVGAGHPVVGSVSKALHELGWRGLHVEPVPAFARALRAERPGDAVVEACVGERKGVVPFWFVTGSTRSTTDPKQADRARRDGWPVHESTVAACTPRDVLEEHLPPGEVHVLRLGVTGIAELLSAADLARYRPWIVVVTAEPGLHGGAPLPVEQLVEHGYLPALFDGVNQWYLARKHQELLPALSYSACSRDGWTRVHVDWSGPPVGVLPEDLAAAALPLAAALAGQRAAEALAAESTKLLRARKEEFDAQRAEARSQHKKIAELERELAKQRAAYRAIESSTFWTLTGPARKLVAALRGGQPRTPRR